MIVDEIVEYEKKIMFDEDNVKDVDGFKFLEGKCPILISAPHSVQIGKKFRENYTAAIGMHLHKKYKVHLIYKTFDNGENANSDEISKYRDRLVKEVERHNVKLVLDLHGMKKERDYDIDIGDHDTENIYNKRIIKIIVDAFTNNNVMNVFEDYIFHARSSNTVSTYTHRKTGINALQLEINGHYRDPIHEREHFSNLIKGFDELIETMIMKIDDKEKIFNVRFKEEIYVN